MTAPDTDASKRPAKRRWFAYSLRTLMIVTAVAALWLGIKTNQVRRQRVAVAAIKASGGRVIYDFQRQGAGQKQDEKPPAPKWLRDLIGDDYFQSVVAVDWDHEQKLKADDLRWLRDLPKLDDLNLNYTNVDDEGLAHLRELTSLKHLCLEQCVNVTDHGLSHLDKLKNLEELALLSTSCSDEAIRKYVPQFERLKYLDVAGIPITRDTAMEFLRLKDLKMLHLSRVGQRTPHDLSDVVKLLKNELPGCEINYWKPFTDGPRNRLGVKIK